MDITFSLIYTASLIVLMSVVLVKKWIGAEITVFGTLVFLLLGEVVTVKEAFAGFSNVGVLTVALLFIVAGALQTTGALDYFTPYIFGNKQGTVTSKLSRILFPISAFSAFLNNTPIVAMFIPTVKSWTEKFNYAPSKFFIPISYAAILGGMCTLIGTSTNLVVHGLLIENNLPGFSFFEISAIGVPVAVAGLLYLIFIGPRLLPDRKEPIIELGEKTREFVCEFKVTSDYQNIGKTIEMAGLRHLKGMFLFQIERNGEVITPARPDEKLLEGDRLFFTGIPKTIVEIQKTPGLQLIKDSSFDLKHYDSDQIKSFEAVISPSSPLLGKNVRQSNFRSRYGAVILAIHRNGERIRKKIGDIILIPGDTLLLLAEKGFRQKWYHSNDFYLISGTTSAYSKPRWQANLAIFIFILMIFLAVFQVMPLITAAGLAAISLVISRSISAADAKNMIDWKVLVVISGAIGIASAIRNSGLADILAYETISLASPFGILGILSGLYVIASFYTNIITSNATAAFLFPIALTTAIDLNLDIRPFALIITIAAAASFASPISYQTNLMVYGPGGYKFKDYLRIGIPLQIISGIIAVTLIYFIYFK